MLLCAADIMRARNDDEATRGGRRPRGGDQLQAEAAKSVKKGVRMRDGGQPAIKLGAFSWCGGAIPADELMKVYPLDHTRC